MDIENICVSKLVLTRNGGYYEFPVAGFGIRGGVLVPGLAVDKVTMLEVSTAETGLLGDLSPLVKLSTSTCSSFFSKPVLVTLPLHADPRDPVLLLRPSDPRPSTPGQDVPWIHVDPKAGHNVSRCTCSPWWKTQNNTLLLFVKYCCEYKLVQASAQPQGDSEGCVLRHAAASVFTKSISSRRLDCSVIFHCGYIDLAKIKSEQVLQCLHDIIMYSKRPQLL